MRFSAKTGGLIDVYQAATQMTDESGQSYPFTPNTLLDNALGPLGYYGAFTVNLHTDQGTTPEDDALISSATSRGVPMVTSKQMLTWLDARNSSSFSAISATGNTLAFTVNAANGPSRSRTMTPPSRIRVYTIVSSRCATATAAFFMPRLCAIRWKRAAKKQSRVLAAAHALCTRMRRR